MSVRRTEASPVSLVLSALGGPRQIAGKARRLAGTLVYYIDPREIPRRLRSLETYGLVDSHPTRLQLFFGGVDMLRFMIEPAARDFYRQKGISFGFHQLLRVLDDPVSMIDPTGFLSARDTIIGHLMQVVHLNPIYDVQLLCAFSDGLDELEGQLEQMLAGTHPRIRTIGSIVEDPEYHGRLLDYVRRYRVDPQTAQMPREEQTLRDDPHFAAAEAQFATLPGFVAYASALPRSARKLLWRLSRVDKFPI